MDVCYVCGGSFSYGLVSVFRLHTKDGKQVCSTKCEANS
jgi:hypothetical protein